MTHINDLPPELLSKIFSIVFVALEEDISQRTNRQSYELLDVLLACRRWSHTAYATPSLWTAVYVTNESGAVQRVQRYLERSGDLPLDVAVTSMTGDGQVQNAEAALLALGNHSTRWRSFSTPFTTSNLIAFLSMALPNLLSFSYSFPLPRPYLTPAPAITLDAPRLESLIAHPDTVQFKHEFWPVLRLIKNESFPALKRLDVQSFLGADSWVWTMLWLSQSSLEYLGLNSEELMWMRSDVFEGLNGHGTAVTSLPSLRTLKVRALSDIAWGTLRFAAMPSLTHLTLDLGWFPTLHDGQQYPSPFSSLQYLSICTYSSSSAADATSLLLKLTPNVTSLVIKDKSGMFADNKADMIVPLLLTSAGEPVVGRKLKEVHLLRVPTSVGKLKQLVDLRAGCLEKIVLTKGWDVDQEGPTTDPETEKLLLAWLKRRVVLEEVEGDWD